MKKVFIGSLVTIFMSSSFIFIYDIVAKKEISELLGSNSNTPAPIATQDSTDISNVAQQQLVTQSIHDQAESGNNVFFFCEPKNVDCLYIQENLFKPLAKSLDMDDLGIKYVDLSILSNDFLGSTMKRHWNFEKFPALVQIHYDNGTLEYQNVMEWSVNNPHTADEVKEWLITVGWLDKELDATTSETIEKPLD